MSKEKDLAQWIVSVWLGQKGDVYVRLYNDAPEWARHEAAGYFGQQAILLRSERLRPQLA